MENWTLDDWLNDLDNCVKRGLYFEISGHSAGLLRDQIKKAAGEIERLQKQIRYQEHRDGRIGTHDPICYGYGPSHYECALRKIDMLRELLNADNQTLRLHFGELTLNEMRIVKAAFQWVLIRAELKEDE